MAWSPIWPAFAIRSLPANWKACYRAKPMAMTPIWKSMPVLAELKAGEPFVYYAGAGWDRIGDFTNQIQWNNYLKHFAERLDQPLQVTVGK